MNRAMNEAAVYRIHWTPGSDLLVGRCHCGAQCRGEDPVTIWAWLLAHPDHSEDTAVLGGSSRSEVWP
jgi:hypothetical protein